MLNYENDDIELDEENEKFRRQLALEQIEETKLAIEQDEHPIETETDEQSEKKKLNRELQALHKGVCGKQTERCFLLSTV